jgi:hypothetical protein
MGRFVGVAHLPAASIVVIFRDGSITSRPYKCSTYKRLEPPSFSSSHSLLPKKKRLRRLWTPPKNCSTKGGDLGLKSFGGEVVEGKEMLFQTFFLKFNGWLVSN